MDIGNPYILTKMKLNIFYTTSSPTQESMNAKEDKGPGSELSCIWKVEMMRHSIEHLNHKIKISQNGFLHQYIPLKTGLVRHMLAPYSSYSAFVWQACTCSTTSSQKSKSHSKNILNWVTLMIILREYSLNESNEVSWFLNKLKMM